MGLAGESEWRRGEEDCRSFELGLYIHEVHLLEQQASQPRPDMEAGADDLRVG